MDGVMEDCNKDAYGANPTEEASLSLARMGFGRTQPFTNPNVKIDHYKYFCQIERWFYLFTAWFQDPFCSLNTIFKDT